ncbi:MAG: ribosome-associated translation inhibitor RaiA [Acidimicrobiia bacterium]|nr:ribosome-associated translation inhibitor RaiA [Acidimicrobiia bacterium]
MNVRVYGRNLHIGDRLRDHAEKKVAHAARFFDHVGDAEVEISEDPNQRNATARFAAKINAPAAGQVVRAAAEGESAFAAVDKAVDRFGQNLSRLHDRLVQRSRRTGKKDLNVTSARAEEEEDPDGIELVRIKQFVMKPMTPEDAALQMEQLGHSFFFFLNAETRAQSVLYRRRDGRLGLIEPA